MSTRTTLQWIMLLAACAVAMPAAAADRTIDITLEAGAHSRNNTPVCVPIDLQPSQRSGAVTISLPGGKQVVGQITDRSLLSKVKQPAELWFVLPTLEAGETMKISATLHDQPSAPGTACFRWKNESGKQAELLFGDRPVLRYMYEKLDTSSVARRDETIKPYHHVYDPAGDTIITKGPGGQFTHHRGLFFGFNKITYGDNQPADVWHCRHGESQQHVAFLHEEAGPVLGRHRVRIEWRGRKDDIFAIEEREMTAYNTTGGTLIDFASRVTTTGGDVKLDGDPQHAGFHFRASNEVSDKTKKETYYLRPDGKGKVGETRNWPAQKQHVNLDWNVMSFVVGGQRYSAAYLDSPKNPKEARFSERDYGRFGSYFEYTVTKERPLAVNYRVWVQRGEMTAENVVQLDDSFENAIKVTVN
jgi:hypothetical protein